MEIGLMISLPLPPSIAAFGGDPLTGPYLMTSDGYVIMWTSSHDGTEGPIEYTASQEEA